VTHGRFIIHAIQQCVFTSKTKKAFIEVIKVFTKTHITSEMTSSTCIHANTLCLKTHGGMRLINLMRNCREQMKIYIGY